MWGYKLCMVESVVPGKSKHLYGKIVSLKISYLTIAQYDVDMQLATQWRFHSSMVSLTCFTVTLWTWSKFYTYYTTLSCFTYFCAHCCQKHLCGSTFVEALSLKRRSKACWRRASMLVCTIQRSYVCTFFPCPPPNTKPTTYSRPSAIFYAKHRHDRPIIVQHWCYDQL